MTGKNGRKKVLERGYISDISNKNKKEKEKKIASASWTPTR